jgi:hypothetical protein
MDGPIRIARACFGGVVVVALRVHAGLAFFLGAGRNKSPHEKTYDKAGVVVK